MSPAGFHVSPQWIAFGVLLGLLTFTATATLYPALWHVAGLVIVVAVGVVTAPLEHTRRDDTVHTAFLG
jgi:sterol desaturase/sphingolipid hydroxylase (fatty acid hydroxylase superfamily)